MAKTIYLVGNKDMMGYSSNDKFFENYNEAYLYAKKLIKIAKSSPDFLKTKDWEENNILSVESANKILKIKQDEYINKERKLIEFNYLSYYKCSYEYEEYDLTLNSIGIYEVTLN